MAWEMKVSVCHLVIQHKLQLPRVVRWRFTLQVSCIWILSYPVSLKQIILLIELQKNWIIKVTGAEYCLWSPLMLVEDSLNWHINGPCDSVQQSHQCNNTGFYGSQMIHLDTMVSYSSSAPQCAVTKLVSNELWQDRFIIRNLAVCCLIGKDPAFT